MRHPKCCEEQSSNAARYAVFGAAERNGCGQCQQRKELRILMGSFTHLTGAEPEGRQATYRAPPNYPRSKDAAVSSTE